MHTNPAETDRTDLIEAEPLDALDRIVRLEGAAVAMLRDLDALKETIWQLHDRLVREMDR